MFNVNTSLIRFWEKEFQIITPKKNRKGNRLFSPKDITNLNKIYHLVKVKGFTLEGAKKILLEKDNIEFLASQEEEKSEDVIEKLEKIKLKLLALKKVK